MKKKKKKHNKDDLRAFSENVFVPVCITRYPPLSMVVPTSM